VRTATLDKELVRCDAVQLELKVRLLLQMSEFLLEVDELPGAVLRGKERETDGLL